MWSSFGSTARPWLLPPTTSAATNRHRLSVRRHLPPRGLLHQRGPQGHPISQVGLIPRSIGGRLTPAAILSAEPVLPATPAQSPQTTHTISRLAVFRGGGFSRSTRGPRPPAPAFARLPELASETVFSAYPARSPRRYADGATSPGCQPTVSGVLLVAQPLVSLAANPSPCGFQNSSIATSCAGRFVRR